MKICRKHQSTSLYIKDFCVHVFNYMKKTTRIKLDGELYKGITIVLANLEEEAPLLFAFPIKLLGFVTVLHIFVFLYTLIWLHHNVLFQNNF